MVSEYADDNRKRVAWATTTDTLVILNSALQLWPDTNGPDDLLTYLTYLLNTNHILKLSDGRTVPL